MIYKIISVLCAIITLTLAQNATICDEEELNAFIPDVRDCNGWFRCGPNGPEAGNCPGDLHFNPITRVCDWPANVECFRCPTNESITTHLMNRSCRSFIRCIGGTSSQHMCESGLQFNNATGQCDLESAVNCTVRFSCPAQLPIDGSVIAIRDPQNCSVYYMCIGAPDPIRLECNPELHFDPISSLCTFPNLTDCTTGPGNPPENPDVPGFTCPSEGMHPHPSSCSIYFICANGHAHQFTCASGLHFSAVTNRCDLPHVVNCDRENFRRHFRD